MTITDIFLYKMTHFVNPRCCPRDVLPYFYQEDETNLLLLSVIKSDGRFLPLSRWYELFPKGQVDRIIQKLGFSDNDSYAIKIMLSRFGYLFQIDNRQRINKDIHLFFYVIQLMLLKHENVSGKADNIHYFFRCLCFELCITDEVYNKFYISNNHLMFSTEHAGDLIFYNVIKDIYSSPDNNATEQEAIKHCKHFQLSVIDLLCADTLTITELPINDINKIWISPEQFLLQYKKSKKRIFDALIQCFDKHQSNENLLTSNIILMNYASYILRKNKKSLFSLQKYINDDTVFSKIISVLALRRVFVDKEYFTDLGLADYLNLSEIENAEFYNLIYLA